ncbi:hypothetical protein EVAR_95960_1 [Eumeta japonica]|uniref:Uncharacterized protein n=1 Tax=Eumeta variegata TaxID=151549 RepID=A0A4C1VB73_EUMVA|nr:hypothetical protein EVAR_95960_1 [Eumeta japonica]
MEPEGKHRNSIMKHRILAVFGLVEIVLRCTLTMNDFQGLMMQLEGFFLGGALTPKLYAGMSHQIVGRRGGLRMRSNADTTNDT